MSSMDLPKSVTVGEYLLKSLHALGIKHIFGVPGDYVLRLNKVIEEHPDIQFINTVRESTAGYAADAYARLNGLGVACITYGVGINISNSMAQAFVESSPLVVISGSVGLEEYKKSPVRHHLINKVVSEYGDSTQLEVFKNFTVDQGVITSGETAAEIIDRVLYQCLQKKKPVYLEIPRDQVDRPVKITSRAKSTKMTNPPSEILKKALKETAKILSQSKYPMMWIGHEILRYGLSQDILKFAENFQIPIVSSLLGKTAIDEHHPLFVGVYQGEMGLAHVIEEVHKSDCFLMLGVIFSDLDTGIFTAKRDHKLRIIAGQDELTIGEDRFELGLTEYIKGLKDLSPSFKKTSSITSRAERIPKKVESKKEIKCSMKHVFGCLQHYLTSEHIVISDVGDCLFASSDLVLSQNSFLACAYFASLGFAVPATIGAQLAEPQRRPVAIVGDGGFQMTAMELSTAVRYHLDPIVILLNNHGYGTERILLEGTYNDILNWNYTNIPQVLGGGVGIKVKTELEFERAIQQSFTHRGNFYLIEVELEKLDFSPALNRLGELLGKIVKAQKED